MSTIKQGSLSISENHAPVSPTNTGSITVVSRNGVLYQYDGIIEKPISNITTITSFDGSITIADISGGYDVSCDLNSTIASISGDLQSQINTKQNNITLVAGSNVTVTESPTDTWTITASISGEGGSGFTPLEGIGIDITPVGADYSFAVRDYIGKTEVADISGSLNTLISNEVTNRTNADLLLTPLTTTASISGSLQSQISAITVPTSASFLSDYDTRYVNVTGDTMTGNLIISSGSYISSPRGSGTANEAFGKNALIINSTGNGNTAVGDESLRSNTTGSGNTAIGHDTLRSNTTGSWNVAIGENSLYANTTGFNNTSIGDDSLRTNTTGSDNTAVGNLTLRNNTTGTNNSAIGNLSLRSNTTGSWNNAVGDRTLTNNTTGFNNVAIGDQSMSSNVVGANNTAIGNLSLSTSIGSGNTAIGNNSLRISNTGNYNTAIGDESGKSLTTGGSNVFIGRISGFNASQKVDAINSIAIGLGTYTTKSNQVVIGNTSIEETLLSGDVYISSLVGISGNILTHDSNGKLFDSGIGIDSLGGYTLLSTTASISGSLQSQIDALSSGGVTSIEGLTGIVDISGGSGISITTAGNSVVITNTGVNSTSSVLSITGNSFTPSGDYTAYSYTLNNHATIYCPTDMENGESKTIRVIQPETVYSLSFVNDSPFVWKFSNGNAPVITSQSDAIDILTILRMDNDIYVTIIKNFLEST